MSLRETIKSKVAASKKVATEIKVPEWDCTLYIRGMTVAERDRYDFLGNQIMRGESTESLRAWVAIACTVNEDGTQIFTKDDVSWLSAASCGPVERIFDAVREASGFLDPKKAEELAEKNLALSE